MGEFVEREWDFFPKSSEIARGSSIIVGRLHTELDEECDAVVKFRHVYKLTKDTQISSEILEKVWWPKEPIIITTNGPPEEISIMTSEGIPWRYGYLFKATKIESVP